MNIAIIIGTHGNCAKYLLETAEMLIGQQKNVAYVDFLPGENTETLVHKYHEILATLQAQDGVLFLLDTWGGSPFNAANRIIADKENYEAISGVNVPMLIEVLMARDDDISLSQLVSIALETGSAGIKASKMSNEPALKKSNLPSLNIHPESERFNLASVNDPQNQGHMKIQLVRIDDRLIHGQVATRWTKETNVNRIIVVSDEVAADQMRISLLKQVAPPGVSGHVININKAIRVYHNPKYANDRVMLLFTHPSDVLRLIEGGVKISSVNVGGMAYTQGKIKINNAISVFEKDIDAFTTLSQLGVKLDVRQVPSDISSNIMDLISKIKNKKLIYSE
ncbi:MULTISPECIES: PTS mannose transporter subunit IIAB [Candidatus Williamhamiltonella]|uniref:PTS system mannose-specific EIIAB component n=1 Tax=Candidatus Williamhamiltonella defendens TaxID=138072 RepID=A0A2D3TBG4_9ENTR|nr:PTS mannose transporter subunit IIAB [Candidatus Hamiltonella defensa]ATW33044.1 PTS mannose transporter subunit IIAB [Candidatus Hamiltonella defensa]AYB49134.1 PTS mannose transporter subunit IIAB [Candidatus Hamiltonella defensa]